MTNVIRPEWNPEEADKAADGSYIGGALNTGRSSMNTEVVKDILTARHRALLDLITYVLEAIAEHKDGMPSGELYALLMGHMTFDTYQTFIERLVKDGFLTNERHLLKVTQQYRDLKGKKNA